MNKVKCLLVISCFLLSFSFACGGLKTEFVTVPWDNGVREIPVYSTSFPLGGDFKGQDYSVAIEYPEYVRLSAAERKSLSRLGVVPSDSIVLNTRLGVSRKKGQLDVSFVPVMRKDGKWFRLASCKLVVKSGAQPSLMRVASDDAALVRGYAASSVLSQGKWAKIRVGEAGVYSLTPSFLASLGFHDISRVRLYGYGGRVENEVINYSSTPDGDYDDLEEIPLFRRKSDALFYAEGIRRWHAFSYNTASKVYVSSYENNPYSSYSYYFLTEGDAPLAIQDMEATASSFAEVTSVPAQTVIDNEEYSWYTSGRNLYEDYNYADHGNKRTYSLPAPGVDSTSKACFSLSFTASSSSATRVNVNWNGADIGSMSIAATGQYDHARASDRTYAVSNMKSRNTVTLMTTADADARLDYIKLDYNRILAYTGEVLPFRYFNSQPADFRITGADANIRVWRLGYPGFPVANVPVELSGDVLSCKVDDPSLRYVALDVTASYATPERVGVIENQNLHGDSACDMVILVPESGKLTSQAQRLADYHYKKDGLRTRVVRADKVYNEFSSGTPDAGAYRRYMKMLYDRAETESDMPRYLLLFGGCVWDNRMLTSECRSLNPKDYLLCYETTQSLNEVDSYVTDDFFGLLDDGEGESIRNEKIDLGIGRIPVVTEADAKIVVDKSIEYMENSVCGSWKNDIYAIGDDGDSYEHIKDAERLAQMLETEYPRMEVRRVYSDAYVRQSSATGNSYPEVTSLLKNVMNNKGALIMNYVGHGSSYQISKSQLLRTEDFKNAVSSRIPLWVTASCELTPYDMLQETIGETALLNKTSGAVAFYSSARAVYSTYNSYLNNYFMKYVLSTDEDGKRCTLGDAAMATKVSLVSPPTIGSSADYTENKLKYALMGDPALALTFPTSTVVIDEINGTPVGDGSASLPQLQAGAKVKVSGHIETETGSRLPSFNGVVTVSLMDSKDTIQCLNNAKDDVEPFVYSEYVKTLYSGTDSVRNGVFETTIPVPLDIKYSNLTGKMSLYAVNNEKDVEANGVCYDFTIGGTDSSLVSDSLGPVIYAYLNTPEFQDGGNVNETPYFFATLNDSDGINATGNGVGHDLELVIDGKESLTYNMNGYYANDFGSHKSGTVSFLVPQLEEGRHSLSFRAWDMKNNSSTAVLNFNVIKGLSPSLLKVSLTRNPASSSTSFIVSYDRPAEETVFTVYVYDCFGRLWYKHTETATTSSGSYVIPWNLTSNNGVFLPDGLYLYKVSISCGGSKEVSKTEKLVIHRQ